MLTSSNYPFVHSKTPEDVIKKAELMSRRNNKSESPPIMVYMLVDSDAAIQEMKTNQPFIFYPEMNGVMDNKVLKYD